MRDTTALPRFLVSGASGLSAILLLGAASAPTAPPPAVKPPVAAVAPSQNVDLTGKSALLVIARVAPGSDGADCMAAAGVELLAASGEWSRFLAETGPDWRDTYSDSRTAAQSSEPHPHLDHADESDTSSRSFAIWIDEEGTRAKVFHESVPGVWQRADGRGVIHSPLTIADLGGLVTISPIAEEGELCAGSSEIVLIDTADAGLPRSHNREYRDAFDSFALGARWQALAEGLPTATWLEASGEDEYLVLRNQASGLRGLEMTPPLDLSRTDVVEVRVRLAPVDTGVELSPMTVALRIEGADGATSALVGATKGAPDAPPWGEFPRWADVYVDSDGVAAASPQYHHQDHGGVDSFRTLVLTIGRRGSTVSVLHEDGSLSPWVAGNPDLTIDRFGSSMTLTLEQDRDYGPPLEARIDELEVRQNGVMVPAIGIHDPGAAWTFEVAYPQGVWSGAPLAASLAHHHLPPPPAIEPVQVGEWGYGFHGLAQDGGPYSVYFPDHTYDGPPLDQADGYDRLRRFYEDMVLLFAQAYRLGGPGAPRPISSPSRSVNSGFLYPHHAARFGADQVDSEIGAGIFGNQGHIAFARGAGRQFGIPWGMQVSPWFSIAGLGSIRDYSAAKVWGDSGDVDRGQSLSFYMRSYYASFMAGATYVMAEAGAVNYFQKFVGEYESSESGDRVCYPVDPDDPDNPLMACDGVNPATGYFDLSPLGAVGAEFYQFSTSHDRGTPVVPVAVVVEQHHGMGFGWWQFDTSASGTSPFDRDPGLGYSYYVHQWSQDPAAAPFKLVNAPVERRHSTYVLEAFWPESFQTSGLHTYVGIDGVEQHQQVATPLGDVADVFLEDVSAPVLSQYPVLVLSGHLELGAEQVRRWTAYMQHGDTIVTLSARDRDALVGAGAEGAPLTPELLATEYPVGQGRLIHVHPAADPRALIAATRSTLGTVLADGVLPVEVDGTIQYLLSETEDAWIVTLINNEGVLKHPQDEEEILPGFDRTVSLTWRTAGIGVASELRSEDDLDVTLDTSSGETVATTTLLVLAGDVRVVRLER
jgi:hypothetical protein